MRAGRDLLRDDCGQTIVLAAVALPMLLALILFVIDGGRLYVERERLHGAAQLAAEAGWSAVANLKLKPSELTDLQRVRAGIDPVVRQALERNLEQPCATDGSQPCRYTLDVVPGSDPDRPGLKVRVTRPFLASVQAVRFTLGAEGLAGAALMLSADRGQPQTAVPPRPIPAVRPPRTGPVSRPAPVRPPAVRQPPAPARPPTRLFRAPSRAPFAAPAPARPVARPQPQPVQRAAPVFRPPIRATFGRGARARPIAQVRPQPVVAPRPIAPVPTIRRDGAVFRHGAQVVRQAPAPVLRTGRPVFGGRLKRFASVL